MKAWIFGPAVVDDWLLANAGHVGSVRRDELRPPGFLTLDKPETLSHNDVRLLTSTTGPRKSQKSQK